MASHTESQPIIYKVVINHEEQYSIWMSHRDVPNGWFEVGKQGTKEECLDYIKQHWIDMRPLSLRKKMQEIESNGRTQIEVPPLTQVSLVERLSQGKHKVEVALLKDDLFEDFKFCLERGYVHIKFTETQGGTTLGLRLDPIRSRFSPEDFVNPGSKISLVADLNLDFVDVTCHAEIEMATLSGTGSLTLRDKGH